MRKYIIYAVLNGIKEVGVAHFFMGRYWWDDQRAALDGNEQAGPYQRTIDRLVKESADEVRTVCGPNCFKYLPPYYEGVPYKILIVIEP